MATETHVPFQADDIWDTPDDGNRYEVIAGDLFVQPPPLDAHQAVVTSLTAVLWGHVHVRKLGYVRVAPFGVVLDAGTGVQPDIVFISNARESILTARGAEGAPDLVVEVLSPSTVSRDRGAKMRRYAAAGVDHYWLLDPAHQTIEELRRGPLGFTLVARIERDQAFRPAHFPELVIDTSELWT